MLDFLPELLPNILAIIENWDRWSEMLAVKLLDIISGSITFENILPIELLEWLVILVAGKNNSKNGLHARGSKNLLVWLGSW